LNKDNTNRAIFFQNLPKSTRNYQENAPKNTQNPKFDPKPRKIDPKSKKISSKSECGYQTRGKNTLSLRQKNEFPRKSLQIKHLQIICAFFVFALFGFLAQCSLNPGEKRNKTHLKRNRKKPHFELSRWK
jgi:hypothetical protein